MAHPLGAIRQGPSFTMTTPAPRQPAAPTQAQELTSPYTGPYQGLEPGTISAQPFLDYMGDVKELALDPRNAIRDREQQRLQEQTRAANTARGLNLSGVGAGIESQAMSDFGLDWQNQQLARAGQGAQQLQLLGGLGQNIAQAGFTNALQLGASQFEYAPDVSGYAAGAPGGFSYSPGAGYGGGLDGGGFGPSLEAYRAARQARQTAPQTYIPQGFTNPRTTAPGRGWTY